MTANDILIVEDEILIAHTIQRYLEAKGYNVIGIAISYEEAVELFSFHSPDLILIDIRLSGSKTGINFAQYLSAQAEVPPFIFLTSQLDSSSLSAAKETFPVGYLSKPIQKSSLYTTIEIALHNSKAKTSEEALTVSLSDGQKNHIIPINDILYMEVDHIYVKVTLAFNKQLICRITLKELLDKIDHSQFVQTHRSFAVNIKRVSNWDIQHLFIEENRIPVSRSRKKEVLSMLIAQK